MKGEIIIKKLLFVILVLLLTTACGSGTPMSEDKSTIGKWTLLEYEQKEGDESYVKSADFQIFENGKCLLTEKVAFDSNSLIMDRKFEGKCYLNSSKDKIEIIGENGEVLLKWTQYKKDGDTISFDNHKFTKVK